MTYDPSGRATECEPPQQNCPAAPRPAEFLEQCRLAGFQSLRCGCRELCAGKVTAAKKYYAEDGSSKSCEPAKSGCKPPETSTAFQDACNDKGQKLVVCGCEWLCTGPIR